MAHWSLPAVERVNPGQVTAIFRAAPDAEDRLEISDPEMVGAIEKVLRAVGRSGRRRGRLRGGIIAAGAIGLTAAMVFWGPGAIRNQAAAILPEAARAALGQDAFEQVRRITGAPCPDALGQQALDRLAARYAPGAKVFVVPAAVQSSATLPGDIILLGRSVVEDHETAFVVAGYLVAADMARTMQDPMRNLLDDATLLEAGRLLTTGRLADRALSAYAERIVQAPGPALDDGALITRFAAANLPTAPYAYARDVSGDTVSALIEANPPPAVAAPLPIDDGGWVALQGICGE